MKIVNVCRMVWLHIDLSYSINSQVCRRTCFSYCRRKIKQLWRLHLSWQCADAIRSNVRKSSNLAATQHKLWCYYVSTEARFFFFFFLFYGPAPFAADCSADRHAYGGGKGKNASGSWKLARTTWNCSGMWKGMKAIIKVWEDIIRFVNVLIYSCID